MGWFVIACLVGFSGFLFWHFELQRPRGERSALVIVAVVTIAVAVVAAAVYICSHSLTALLDVLGSGRFARILLGLVLGAGAAYVMAQRTVAPIGRQTNSRRADPPRPPGPPANGDGADKKGLSTHLVLSTGLGIVILALMAPHIDRWLSHLTNFKTPVVEFQVTATVTHKVRLAEDQESFNDTKSLLLLSTYANRINQDIIYLAQYERENRIIEPTQRLLWVFEKLISPIAGCVQTALNNGLTLDSARNLIRPTADLLEQIILGEDNLRAYDELSSSHDQFWQQVMELPAKVRPFLGTKEKDGECSTIPRKYFRYYDQLEGLSTVEVFPRIENYKDVPYLYVAAALFISFMNDDEMAFKILQKANPKFIDHSFLYLAGQLSHYRGKPGDLDDSYFGYLNMLRKRAGEHIARLKESKQECTSAGDLLCREQAAELVAMNAMVYFLAEDVARENAYAIPYKARMEEYADEIKRILDVKAEYDPTLSGSKYFYLDTYAYARLVIETQRPELDQDKVRCLIHEFDKVVEHAEEDAKSSEQTGRLDLSQLKIARAHRAAALALIEDGGAPGSC